MANTIYRKNTDDARKRRKEGGLYIKGLRTKAKLSQLELSNKLGLDYYTMISQVENGATRVPPAALREWAAALNVDVSTFAKAMLRYNDPHTFDAIFNSGKKSSG